MPRTSTRRHLLSVGATLVFLGMWQAYVSVAHVPPDVVPGPGRVWQEIVYLWSGELPRDIVVTLSEIGVGMVYGILVGFGLGIGLAKSPLLQRLLTPLLLMIQTAPKISLAPLLILWFGLGLLSKAVLVAIAVFYPVMVNLSTAIRDIDPNTRYLFQLLQARPRDVFWHLELPAAMPGLLAGIRVGSTQAVTAVVIGELVGAKAGLGYLLSSGQNNADITMVMASVGLLSLMGYVLYVIFRGAETWLVKWTDSPPPLL